jgi:AmmeMemoRadiSam system protein B
MSIHLRPTSVKLAAASAAIVLIGVATMTWSKPPSPPSAPSAPLRLRQPAVAGQFYPDDPGELRSMIGSQVQQAKPSSTPVRMIISPHAGYIFSGPVAAFGFASLPKTTDRVIIIGPSHHALFTGLSIADVDAYAMPLGNVPLDKQAVAELRKSPLVQSVERADGPEHSVEVQIPFLQVMLPKFAIVPIVVGKVDPAQAAALLAPLVTSTTVVVASSDFSHYHQPDEAKALDDRSVQTILGGNADGFLDACGEVPIRIVMRMAKQLGLSPVLLDKRNSGDTAPQYGTRRGVVGYASIGFLRSASTAN